MDQFLKLTDWLFTWPLRLPFWLWERDSLGRLIAATYLLLILATVFAVSYSAVAMFMTRTAQPSPPAVVIPEETPTPELIPAETPVVEETPTPTETPVPPADTPTPMPTFTPTDTPVVEAPTPAPVLPAETPTPLPTLTPTDTPTPTFTPTDTPTPTPTDTPTPLPPDTPTPIPPATPTPTDTPLPPTPEAAAPVVRATAIQDAPLRLGPGTGYPMVGRVATGEEVRVYARTANGQWLQVDPLGFTWIAATNVDLAADIADVQVAQAIPPVPIADETPTPTPGRSLIPGFLRTPTPTPTPEPDLVEAEEELILVSGGLGLAQDAWEELMGEGAFDEQTQRYHYLGGAAAGGFDVNFWEEQVWLIHMQLDAESVVSPEDLENLIEWLIPQDSQLLDMQMAETPPQTETPTETLVGVYQSEWLAEAFGEAVWLNEPGVFIIQYMLDNERVTAFTISAYLDLTAPPE